ncbi:DUF4412 domain-containing protein [Oleiharenicola lentus]|uniref:DUF4412 domain-containing protein n=1 Tax=Oleiharenicola lentus TaxID=2508720 RepID=UPI003F66648F
MNLLSRLVMVGALLASVQTRAASAFEGKVDLAISTGAKGAPQALSYSIKGDKLRLEMAAEGHAMASIVDTTKQEILVLIPDQKMYMVMPLKQGVETAAKAGGVNTDVQVEATGKTDTILGYKCEQVLVKDKNQVTEVWLAEGLGTFAGLGSGGNPFGGKKPAATAKWEEALKGKSGFPLRVITRDLKSNETFKMEATKITPGALSAALFQPPAGFQKFQMPDLGGFNPFK